MSIKRLTLGLLSAAVLAAPTTGAALAEDSVFIPLLVYRTGAYAPNGIPLANGFRDYFTLLNERDGGVGGAKIVFEECETQYDTKQGVECYERLKNQHGGAVIVNPYSTGITYQLIPKAPVDKIVIHSMGYGRTDSSDGSVFPWAFTMPTTYWSQASAFVKYIADQEGGMDKLKDKKISLVYHNSPYGKEPIPTLETLRDMHGYQLDLFPVDHPGQEQKSTWLQIRRIKPDWILLWGWGVMNQVAVKEAASISYPMDHFIGVWWSGSESDVRPAGSDANGYKSGTFHAPGAGFPVHAEIVKHVYGGDEAKAKQNSLGEVLYNRGVLNATYNIEAIRIAQEHFGTASPDAEQVRWGYEHFVLTVDRIRELGMEGFVQPVELSCADHEGNGPVILQQWDGEKWAFVSDWIEPMRDVVRPMIEMSAKDYASQNSLEVRDCSKEM